jgi:hypothetical protein
MHRCTNKLRQRKVYNDKIEVTYVVIEFATKLTIGLKFDAEEAAYFVPFISKSF